MNKNRAAPQPPQRTRPLLECGFCGRLAPVGRVGIVCRCQGHRDVVTGRRTAA